MLQILSENTLDLNFPYTRVDSLDDLDPGVKVIIIDYEFVDFEKIIHLTANLEVRVIVIDDAYSQAVQRMCFESDIYLYIFDHEIMCDYLNSVLALLNKKYKIFYKVLFNDENRAITVDDVALEVPRKEYYIFKYLYERLGTVCDQTVILTDVLGYHESSETRLVSVYVRFLRKRLMGTNIVIETVRKKGYVMRIISS